MAFRFLTPSHAIRWQVTALRHHQYRLAAVLQALGADFVPYLQYVVPKALASVAQDDGTWDDDDEEEDEDEDDEEEDPEAEARRAQRLSIRTGAPSGQVARRSGGQVVRW